MSTPVHSSLGVHVTNTAADPINHGDPAAEDGFTGKAVKQKTRGWGDGVANQAQIDVGEDYYLITQGVTEFALPTPALAAHAQGDPIYVADGKLTMTGAAGTCLGRITALPGVRGCPANAIRVDLSAKDSVAVA